MISVTRYRGALSTFETRAREALSVLAQRPGFVRGTLARSTDDVADWVLVTEWRDVGSYRRALGNYAVKLAATGLLGEAVNEPTSFETLLEARPGEAMRAYGSDVTGEATASEHRSAEGARSAASAEPSDVAREARASEHRSAEGARSAASAEPSDVTREARE